VISPRNHLLFTPMLPSSAVGTVNQRSICQPVRPVCVRKNARFYESRVVGIDKKEKHVVCRTLQGEEYNIAYDKLVISVGFQPNDFGVPGVKENALFMKETADATKFKDHILERLEEAAYTHALDGDITVSPEEEKRIRQLLTFVVVGGGPTGVELTGEITDFLSKEGAKYFGDLRPWMKVYMFTFDFLNMYDKQLQEYAERHLSKNQNVEIHTGAAVQKLTEDVCTVKLGDGSIKELSYGTLVWCAGIKPHPFVKNLGVAMNERGSQILTGRKLIVQGENDIYAVGDCGTIEDYWLPQTAQVAKQQAQYLAKTLNSAGPGAAPPKNFVFQSLGMMTFLGSNTALMAKLPGLDKLTGFFAFLAWRSVYWSLQLSMRNRFMLSTDWLRTLIWGRDLTRFGDKSGPE